jgi:hypothetical protein
MAGYSGTPLVKKLGIKPGVRVFAMNAPEDYAKFLGKPPQDASIISKPSKEGAPIAHLFVTSQAELARDLPKARKAMTQDGALWVSWYRKSAKIPTDVTEGEIWGRALKTDLVDVKVCAVTESWSGLKLAVRTALR